jgi:hypothetical protein
MYHTAKFRSKILGCSRGCSKSSAFKKIRDHNSQRYRLADEGLSASNVERPVQLLLESPTENATVVAEVNREHILEAQKLVKDADRKDLEQNYAVRQAVQKLYTYPPRSGQLNTLQHLLYTRTDLILIAKTSFGKNV